MTARTIAGRRPPLGMATRSDVDATRDCHVCAKRLAEGEKDQRIREADGYRLKRINEAEGDVARFGALLAEYVKAPEFTRRQLEMQSRRNNLEILSETLHD